jgi:plasmid stability protein
MSQILVRNINPRTLRRLKKRAAAGGRSLQNEVKTILDRAAQEKEPLDPAAALALADRVRGLFRGRKFSDSTPLVREDRDR